MDSIETEAQALAAEYSAAQIVGMIANGRSGRHEVRSEASLRAEAVRERALELAYED